MKTLQIDAFKHNILQTLKAIKFSEFAAAGVGARLKSKSDDDGNEDGDSSEEKFASTQGLTSEDDSLSRVKLQKDEIF